MKYSIYQLNKTEEGKKLLHATYKDAAKRITPKLYEKVWTGEIEQGDAKTVVDAIMKELANGLPTGFYGHEISVSDIIVLEDGTANYVDATGYEVMPAFDLPL